MSKKSTYRPALDHDGDGKNGGSLPKDAPEDVVEIVVEASEEPAANETPPAEHVEPDPAAEPAADQPDSAPAEAGDEQKPDVDTVAPDTDEPEALTDDAPVFEPAALAAPKEELIEGDPVDVEAEVADPVALSVMAEAALMALGSNRYGLYKSSQGYSLNNNGPFIAAGVVEQLVEMQLAYVEPTGGREGSVKITRLGKTVLRDQRRAA